MHVSHLPAGALGGLGARLDLLARQIRHGIWQCSDFPVIQTSEQARTWCIRTGKFSRSPASSQWDNHPIRLENKRWLVYKEITPWLEFTEKFMVDIITIQASSVPASDSVVGDMYFNGIWSAVLSWCSEEIFLPRCTPLERSWAGTKAFIKLEKRNVDCHPGVGMLHYLHFYSVSQSALQCQSICSVSSSIIGEGSA